MSLSIEDIARLFSLHGARQYSGEPVTQLEHALQTAWLAEQADAGDELVTACLLHDLGHMLNDQGETPSLRGVDDVHQYFALPFLRGRFSARVLDPIRLHVDAKRYLCQADPGYWAALTIDSRRSLQLQGGIFSQAESAQFIAQSGATNGVQLRRWDDRAKQVSMLTPPLTHFLLCAERCQISSATAA